MKIAKKGPRPVERDVETPRGLEDTSFTWEHEAPHRRLILAIDGLDGHGKTHLAFTAPDPICYMYLDNRHEGVSSKFEHKRIGMAGYRVPLTTEDEDEDSNNERLKQAAKRELARWKNDYYTALRNPEVRTIVWDTCTELRDLIRLSLSGRLGAMKMRKDLRMELAGAMNTEFRDMVREARNFGVNLLLLNKVGKQYRDDEWTGEYERKSFTDTGFLVDCAVQTRLDVEEKKFIVTCTKAGIDFDLIGYVWKNPTFQDVATMLVPESESGDWE